MRLWMMKLNESPSKQAFMILLLNWEIDEQQAENHDQKTQPNQEAVIHEQNTHLNQEPEIHDQKTL
jgi:hypothetical protein